MVSIQSRSPSSRLGTVESAPTDMLTKEARSSNSSLQVAMSISGPMSNFISPLALFCGLEDDTSPLCGCDLTWFDVETTWLLLLLLTLALFRLMDNVVVDDGKGNGDVDGGGDDYVVCMVLMPLRELHA